MGLMYVTVTLRVPGLRDGGYEGLFLVDSGAIDSMAPASKLAAAGFQPVGRSTYELADGSVHEYPFALAQIEFMGEVTAGRVIFGPEGSEPLLGVTALESVGIILDPATRTLKRLPAVPLKSFVNSSLAFGQSA
jgi:clan AA aspartic protease